MAELGCPVSCSSSFTPAASLRSSFLVCQGRPRIPILLLSLGGASVLENLIHDPWRKGWWAKDLGGGVPSRRDRPLCGGERWHSGYPFPGTPLPGAG